MKACLALLVDDKMHNFSRKMAFELNEKYKTGFIAARLPQHITLGPVFEIEEIEEIESYFDSLAEGMSPLQVRITDIDLMIAGDDEVGLGVLWMGVEESEELRGLHNSIYKYISEHEWKTDMTGEYKFHSTIALGEQPPSVYREIFESIPNKRVNHSLTVRQIALFVTTDIESRMGTYVTYKILGLKGSGL